MRRGARGPAGDGGLPKGRSCSALIPMVSCPWALLENSRHSCCTIGLGSGASRALRIVSRNSGRDKGASEARGTASVRRCSDKGWACRCATSDMACRSSARWACSLPSGSSIGEASEDTRGGGGVALLRVTTGIRGCAYGGRGGGGRRVRTANRNERSRGRSLLHGHGTFSTSKAGGWRLAVGGCWRLAVGGWRLLAVGGWRLVVPGAVLQGCP